MRLQQRQRNINSVSDNTSLFKAPLFFFCFPLLPLFSFYLNHIHNNIFTGLTGNPIVLSFLVRQAVHAPKFSSRTRLALPKIYCQKDARKYIALLRLTTTNSLNGSTFTMEFPELNVAALSSQINNISHVSFHLDRQIT